MEGSIVRKDKLNNNSTFKKMSVSNKIIFLILCALVVVF